MQTLPQGTSSYMPHSDSRHRTNLTEASLSHHNSLSHADVQPSLPGSGFGAHGVPAVAPFSHEEHHRSDRRAQSRPQAAACNVRQPMCSEAPDQTRHAPRIPIPCTIHCPPVLLPDKNSFTSAAGHARSRHRPRIQARPAFLPPTSSSSTKTLSPCKPFWRPGHKSVTCLPPTTRSHPLPTLTLTSNRSTLHSRKPTRPPTAGILTRQCQSSPCTPFLTTPAAHKAPWRHHECTAPPTATPTPPARNLTP